jgi:DNA-binding transcriptional MerR regulator
MMIRIGDFARMAQVSIRLLHHYDELGLLKPAHIDPETGYRYYQLEQLARLYRILAFRDLGISLEQIRELLTRELSSTELRGMLILRQAQLMEHIAEEQARLARVEARIQQIDDHDYEVVLKSVPVQHILSIRKTLPLEGYHIRPLMQSMRQALSSYDAPWWLIFHGNLPDDQHDFEGGLQVGADCDADITLPTGEKLMLRELPPIELAATVIHQGDWRPHAYHALMRWVKESGYQVIGSLRQRLLRFEPERSITEMILPVSHHIIGEENA